MSAPTLEYWHVHVDGRGVSRQERRDLAGFTQQVIAPGNDPVWVGPSLADPCRVVTAVLPVGAVGDWHENPLRQWIVVLSGRWFVETMDGMRVEMGPGELSLGGDQGCLPIDLGDGMVVGPGHRSGAVGGEACTLLLIQFA